jgi:hypothetical protein
MRAIMIQLSPSIESIKLPIILTLKCPIKRINFREKDIYLQKGNFVALSIRKFRSIMMPLFMENFQELFKKYKKMMVLCTISKVKYLNWLSSKNLQRINNKIPSKLTKTTQLNNKITKIKTSKVFSEVFSTQNKRTTKMISQY